MKLAEGLKSLMALLLFLSLLGLTCLLWLDDLRPGDEALPEPVAAAARALGLLSAPPEGLPAAPENSYAEAARPLCLALTAEGIHRCAWEGAEASGLYLRARGRMGEALGSAGTPSLRSESEWRDALMRDSLYWEYAAAQPLPALALWLAGEPGALPDVLVKRLALSAGRDAMLLWYIDERDGRPYACQTALRSLELEALASDGLRPARFGWESGDFSRAPYLLWEEGEEAVSVPVASYAPPAALGSAETGAFLLALGINPDTNARFPSQEGTTYMDVDNNRACRFEPSGRVYYRAPAGAPGTPDASETVGIPVVLEEIELSRRLLSALSPLLGEASFSLRTVESGKNGVDTLSFAYELAGLEAIRLGETPPARLVFADGKLIEADILILTFAVGQTRKDLPPLRWAYRMAEWEHPDETFDLGRAYWKTAEGQLVPGWHAG